MTDTEGTGGFTPPYLTFSTSVTFLDRMKERGLPDRIDRTALDGFSGSAQYQLLHMLGEFKLIDADGRPSAKLRELVAASESERKKIVGGILREFYAGAIALGDKNATAKQLADWFESHSIQGSTVRKAIRFFLQAAEFAGIETSRYFKTPTSTRRPAGGTGTKKQRPAGRAKKNGGGGATPPATDVQPNLTLEQLRLRYINDLMERGMGDNMDPELLNRIERLLGFQESSTTPESGEGP